MEPEHHAKQQGVQLEVYNKRCPLPDAHKQKK